MMDNATMRGAYFGILGTIAGAAGGVLLSVVLASVFSASCFADSCLWSYLRGSSIAGAIVGMLLGAYLGKAGYGKPAPQPGKRRGNEI